MQFTDDFAIVWLSGSEKKITLENSRRRVRLTVRTEPSQGLNTGSIPVRATNNLAIVELINWQIEM